MRKFRGSKSRFCFSLWRLAGAVIISPFLLFISGAPVMAYSWPDVIPPTLTSMTPTGTSGISGVVVDLNYYDDSPYGVIARIYIDGFDITRDTWPYQCTWTYNTNTRCNIRDLTAGPHLITGTLTDGSGNKTTFSSSFVAVSPYPPESDTQPPKFRYQSLNGMHFADSAQFSADVSDPAPASGIDPASGQISINGGAPIACSISSFQGMHCDLSGLQRGHYNYTVSFSDVAGNTATYSSWFDVGFTAHIRDDAFGGDCGSIGLWDMQARTCTLGADFHDVRIVIDGDDVTLDGDGHLLQANRSTGISLENRHGVTISNIRLENWITAISIQGGDQNQVTGNFIDNVDYCLNMTDTNSNYIRDNEFYAFDFRSVYLLRSNNNEVTGNTLASYVSNTYGMAVELGSGNLVSTNIVSGNLSGIVLLQTSVNSVTGNHVPDNDNGIVVAYANDNEIIHNTIESSSDIGLLIVQDEQYALPGIGNRIHQNNFIDNAVQASVSGGLTGNLFNQTSPLNGNFWSDLSASDNNSDGIVDQPYVFARGQDDRPWASKNGWTRPALSLTRVNVYWQDYVDYTMRNLSVDFRVDDSGPAATGAQLVGAFCTASVTPATDLPLALGDIGTEGSAPFTITYHVPPGVLAFETINYVTAMGSAGDIFEYPGPFPSV